MNQIHKVDPNELDKHGYQVIEQLGCNRAAGRVTYKTLDLVRQKNVVIKQFRFLDAGDWNDYKLVEREINVLKSLNHPGIPQYLDSFSTDRGICFVQEYIDAPCLDPSYAYSSEEIYSIARQALLILYYLQSQTPIIIHRDIKPENLLWSSQKKLYLIDFGLARNSRTNSEAASSILAGTLGFMPPEQLLGRTPNASSDLYSLGITLCCLLLRKSSREIADLIDDRFRFVLPRQQLRYWDKSFLDLIEALIEPERDRRIPNARQALDKLERLTVQPTSIPHKNLTIVSPIGTPSINTKEKKLTENLLLRSSKLNDTQFSGLLPENTNGDLYRIRTSPKPIASKGSSLTSQKSGVARWTCGVIGAIGAGAISMGIVANTPSSPIGMFPFSFFEPELSVALEPLVDSARSKVGISFALIRALFFFFVGWWGAKKLVEQKYYEDCTCVEAILLAVIFLSIALDLGAIANSASRTPTKVQPTAPASTDLYIPEYNLYGN